MNNTMITEIAQFTILPGISDEEFIKIVVSLEENFHKSLTGYIDSELVKGKEKGEWVLLMHWNSLEEAKEASKLMMQTPSTEAFRQTLDPKNVKLSFFKQIQSWRI